MTDKAFGVGVDLAKKIVSVTGHALIGGARALVNGGKFLTGFLSGGLGKLVTFGTNSIKALENNIFAKGLVVAAAGGAVSVLAGGSFELGFLTAGLAFAVNQVLTLQSERINEPATKKIKLDPDNPDRLLPDPNDTESINGVRNRFEWLRRVGRAFGAASTGNTAFNLANASHETLNATLHAGLRDIYFYRTVGLHQVNAYTSSLVDWTSVDWDIYDPGAGATNVEVLGNFLNGNQVNPEGN